MNCQGNVGPCLAPTTDGKQASYGYISIICRPAHSCHLYVSKSSAIEPKY
jgi:hypothetical protein